MRLHQSLPALKLELTYNFLRFNLSWAIDSDTEESVNALDQLVQYVDLGVVNII